MARKPIFDAVKKERNGRQWTDPDVLILDEALDRLGVPRDPPPPDKAPIVTAKAKLIAIVGASAAALLTGTIAMWEGKENVGYLDIAKIPTACYGDTENVVVGKLYSDEECELRLYDQARRHVEPVLKCTPSLREQPYLLAAAGSLAYNIGPTAYCTSTVDRRFDAGDEKGACDAILMWNRAGGRVVQGLVNRRQWERDLCLKGL